MFPQLCFLGGSWHCSLVYTGAEGFSDMDRCQLICAAAASHGHLEVVKWSATTPAAGWEERTES